MHNWKRHQSPEPRRKGWLARPPTYVVLRYATRWPLYPPALVRRITLAVAGSKEIARGDPQSWAPHSKLQVWLEIHTPFVRAAVCVSTHITVSCSSALLHRLRPRTTHHARHTTHAASRARSIPLPTQPTRPAGSTLSVSLVKPRPPWPSHPRASPPRRLVGLPPLPHTAPPGCVACSQVALAGICRRACSFSASLAAFRARTSRVDARPSATATPCRITIR